MANLLERVQNVFDNRQDRDRDNARENAREQGHQQALYETRDALLGSAVALKEDWTNELARNRSEAHASINARYEARVQGLNDAFAVLRQAEAGITTQLNPDEFRESATRQAQARTYEAPEHQHSPYQYAYAVTRQQDELLLGRGAERPILNHDEYQAGYNFMKETLERKWEAWQNAAQQSGVTPSKDMEHQAVHDMALKASQSVRDNWGDRGRGPERLDDPDFDRGSRKALMDWSHEHNHRLVQEQQRARSEELSRPGQEYGISY